MHPNRDFHQHQQRPVVSAFPDWVLLQNLTFGQATSAATVAMFQLLRGGTERLFYTAASTLSLKINELYARRQSEIQLLFHGAQPRIHISSDLWSSTNELSLLGVIAHFLDALNKHDTVLLGLPRIWGNHDVANQAKSILEIARLSPSLIGNKNSRCESRRARSRCGRLPKTSRSGCKVTHDPLTGCEARKDGQGGDEVTV